MNKNLPIYIVGGLGLVLVAYTMYHRNTHPNDLPFNKTSAGTGSSFLGTILGTNPTPPQPQPNQYSGGAAPINIVAGDNTAKYLGYVSTGLGDLSQGIDVFNKIFG